MIDIHRIILAFSAQLFAAALFEIPCCGGMACFATP
jgi:hypothetical protein